jgi:hypothetical protein
VFQYCCRGWSQGYCILWQIETICINNMQLFSTDTSYWILKVCPISNTCWRHRHMSCSLSVLHRYLNFNIWNIPYDILWNGLYAKLEVELHTRAYERERERERERPHFVCHFQRGTSAWEHPDSWQPVSV